MGIVAIVVSGLWSQQIRPGSQPQEDQCQTEMKEAARGRKKYR
jgi:hypothetical protein